MSNEEHLTLRLICLKAAEPWINKRGEITFFFSQAGIGVYTSRTVMHRIGKSDILVLNGAADGKLSAEDKGDFRFRTFSFNFEHLFPLFESNEISLLNHVIDNLKSVKIYAGNSALALECQKLLEAISPELNLEHRGQLLKIATSILTVEFKNAQNQRGGLGRPTDHMLLAFEKLSSKELRTLSVGELAKKFNCSRRHLNRLFQGHFGISVAALKMEMRLLKAVSLLRDAEIKIINVAEQCGFNHLGLFNICFKRRFGASPGAWRKSQMRGEVPVPGVIAGPQSCPLKDKGICPWTGWSAALADPRLAAAVLPTVTPPGTALTTLPAAGIKKNAPGKIQA